MDVYRAFSPFLIIHTMAFIRALTVTSNPIATKHEQCAYELVREQQALTVARINSRNSALSDALLRCPSSGWLMGLGL